MVNSWTVAQGTTTTNGRDWVAPSSTIALTAGTGRTLVLSSRRSVCPYSTRPLTFGLKTFQSFFLTEPSEELVEEYGYTYDASAYAGHSIEASFPPFQWPVQRMYLLKR